MDCERVRAAIYLAGDEESDDELLSPYRDHLDCCPDCAARLDHVMKLVALLRRRCRRQSAPSELRDRILSNLPHRGGMSANPTE